MIPSSACALSLAAQCIVIGPVCVFACLQRAGGGAVSEPYYSQRARSVCVSLSAFHYHLQSFYPHTVRDSGAGTGGSGGSMNRGPELLGPPSGGATETF